MSKNVNGKIDAGIAIKPRAGHDNSGFIASHWQPTDLSKGGNFSANNSPPIVPTVAPVQPNIWWPC